MFFLCAPNDKAVDLVAFEDVQVLSGFDKRTVAEQGEGAVTAAEQFPADGEKRFGKIVVVGHEFGCGKKADCARLTGEETRGVDARVIIHAAADFKDALAGLAADPDGGAAAGENAGDRGGGTTGECRDPADIERLFHAQFLICRYGFASQDGWELNGFGFTPRRS